MSNGIATKLRKYGNSCLKMRKQEHRNFLNEML